MTKARSDFFILSYYPECSLLLACARARAFIGVPRHAILRSHLPREPEAASVWVGGKGAGKPPTAPEGHLWGPFLGSVAWRQTCSTRSARRHHDAPEVRCCGHSALALWQIHPLQEVAYR